MINLLAKISTIQISFQVKERAVAKPKTDKVLNQQERYSQVEITSGNEVHDDANLPKVPKQTLNPSVDTLHFLYASHKYCKHRQQNTWQNFRSLNGSQGLDVSTK